MGMKTIKAEIASIKNDAYSEGYSEGYDSGEEAGYSTGHDDGIQAERERIENVIKMKIVWAMEEGKGTQIVFWKNCLELLIDLPRHVANNLTEDSLRGELKEFGF